MKKHTGITIIMIGLLLAMTFVGCTREQRQQQEPEKFPMTICHATGSETNPYVSMTLNSQSALNGHKKHEGDLIPAPEGGCPGVDVVEPEPSNTPVPPTPVPPTPVPPTPVPPTPVPPTTSATNTGTTNPSAYCRPEHLLLRGKGADWRHDQRLPPNIHGGRN